MSLFLKVVGLTNAAVWLGAAVLFSLAIWPAFNSAEMLQILPVSHAGAASQVVTDRYFALQYCCALIALIHLVSEWLYAGKPLPSWTLYLVMGMLILVLVNGLSVEPKLKRLHLDLYGRRSTPQQRELASKSAPAWQTVLRVSNLMLVLGLWVYVFEISSAGTTARFINAAKLRG